MSEQAQGAGAPISIDIAGAIAALEGNPDLVNHLQELAFGPLAARQIAVRDEIIERMESALQLADGFLANKGYSENDPLLRGAIRAALAKARGEA